jgi:hypothetical protein
MVDACGVALDDLHQWLPARVSDWPRPKRKLDAERRYHWWNLHAGCKCWWCDRFPATDVHHICQAGYGRSDEPTLLTAVCRPCHDTYARTIDLPRWLQLKWEKDRPHTSWVHLAIRHGAWLPEIP